MTNRDSDKIKAVLRQGPSRIPVHVSILPAAWMKYREDLADLLRRFPDVVAQSEIPEDYDELWREFYRAGEHVDAWGCVWSNLKTGMDAIVTGHPCPTREDVHTLVIPAENDRLPHGYMYLRLSDLRGFVEIMIDFAEEPPELQILIDKVLEYNLRQVQLVLSEQTAPGQFIYLGDDLGAQHALPISPDSWRKYLKPCFQRIFKPIRNAGHFVYQHTDGHILEIIPDLIECGAHVLNPQIGANGLENLARLCKGKICVDLDLDRQSFPFWNASQIDDHIREVVDVLGDPAGGLWLRAEIADDVSLENIEAICMALDKYSQSVG